MSEQEEDFAALFEASEKALRFEQGQTVEGMVVAFGAEVAFVSIGGKSEAQIDLAELKDNEGNLEVAIGDRISAVVVDPPSGSYSSSIGLFDPRSSGNAFYDNAALRAVMAAGPFPKLPDDWTKPSLRILFTFDLRRG